MGPVDKAHPHQGILCAEDIGINFIQLIPAQVVVTVAGSAGKIGLGHPVLLKGGEHLLGILLRDGIDAGKDPAKIGLGLLSQRPHSIAYL